MGNHMPSNHEASRVVDKEGIAPTVKENHGTVTGIEQKFRIRKLTPRECWRLMDFTDEDFDKAKYYSKEESKKLLEKYPNHKGKRQFASEERIERMSDTQLYKQAGNSICVGVLHYIFRELYEAMPYLFDDLKVSSYFSGIGAFESALDRLFDDINSGFFISTDSAESAPVVRGERNIIIYDDYNSNVRTDQTTIGTITSTIGNRCLRNGYKLIDGGKTT